MCNVRSVEGALVSLWSVPVLCLLSGRRRTKEGTGLLRSCASPGCAEEDRSGMVLETGLGAEEKQAWEELCQAWLCSGR
eukprot:1161587-Pelagomonas_calceolata.AAC.17